MITDRLSRASDIAPESGSKTLDSKVQNSLPPARLVQTVIGALAVRDTATSLTGDTIVLWPSILANYQIYQVPIEAWIGRHRLVVIDGPGHGDSGPAPEPFTMKQCGQAMSEILDELGVSTPAIIVGCSWGGLVAGEFAIDYPSRTKAVVMLNTPIHNKKGGLKLSDRFVVWGARWLHTSRVYQDGVARSFFLQKTFEQGGPMMDAFRQHLQRANGAALARSVRSVMLEREPLAPRLRVITTPTLFIAGRFDRMYLPETLRDAVLSMPRGRFEVLDTSHISVVDEPEQTVSLINNFIATL
jgi:pimeloyl-ACP methyl ester carboxylesterase